ALCYLLKSPDCPQDLVDQAAREMAALFWTSANLIPVPDRHGDTSANRRLAEAIARSACWTTKVYDLLGRDRPVDSSCDRHKQKDMPMTVEEHHITGMNGETSQPRNAGVRLWPGWRNRRPSRGAPSASAGRWLRRTHPNTERRRRHPGGREQAPVFSAGSSRATVASKRRRMRG
ncbi:MAG: hypothetical protein WCK89_19210, partial [bacterium]